MPLPLPLPLPRTDRRPDEPAAHGRHRRRRRASAPALLIVPSLAVGAAFTVPALLGGSGERAAAGTAPASRPAAPAAAAGASRVVTGRADRSARRPPLPTGSAPSPRRERDRARRVPAHHRPARHHHGHSAPAWVRPDIGPLSSPYGYRPSMGDFHPGIDLAGPYGSPIRAAAAGRIVFAGPAAGFGQMIRIAHPGGIVTVYGHMSRIARTSGRVRAGQVIAYEGSEGRSTGPHLHFEVYVHGQRVDPLRFLRRHHVAI